jgi:very-short-patch-repair endonuclease
VGDRKQFSRDVERMNALVGKGFKPLQFTYDHVTLDEAWVVGQLRSALGL